MFEKICSVDNLFEAWKEFSADKRKKLDVQEFERNLETNIFELRENLLAGRYCHSAYHRFHIFEPKHRIIHKATVRDRLVHRALYRVLYPAFDRSFIFDSYSCRIGKGTHAAVRRLEDFVRRVSRNFRGACWVLKFDIRKFFDSVDHEILLRVLRKKVSCERTFSLLENIVRSYQTVGGGILNGSLARGLPIGNLTSQLFANTYFDKFDHFIKETLRESFYIRYTDDAVIVSDDKERLSILVGVIADWLGRERKLALHPRKVEIRKLSQGIDFLGYVVLPHRTVLRTKTKRRMIECLTMKNVASYFGLLKYCNGEKLRSKLRAKVATKTIQVRTGPRLSSG